MTVPSPAGEAHAPRPAQKRPRDADSDSDELPDGYTAVPASVFSANPDGFYARYARIPAASRRTVLIRLPRSVPTSALAGVALRPRPKSSGHVADLPHQEGASRRRLVRGGSAEIPAVLLVPAPGAPGSMALAALDDMWTVCEDAPARPAPLADASVRMAEAAVEGGRPIPQPPGLCMRLSPFDLSTVLDK